jgi:hypothetical protein
MVLSHGDGLFHLCQVFGYFLIPFLRLLELNTILIDFYFYAAESCFCHS